MDLRKEMFTTLRELTKGDNLYEEAIKIAEKYAEEMCKKEREIFADKFGKDCPNCENIGYTAEHDPCDPHEDGVCSNCPIQVQCEFCYTEPLSKFNILNAPLATEEK